MRTSQPHLSELDICTLKNGSDAGGAWSDRRLFHTPTPNWSPLTRQVCFVGYGFRWIQPKDGMFVEPAMEAATCPILKQMLGYTVSAAAPFASLPT